MRRNAMLRGVVTVGVCVCFLCGAAPGQEPPASKSKFYLLEYETLTNGFFGLADMLDAQGIALELTVTDVYQHNLHGGLKAGSGRNSLSYDLGIELDLETILGLSGGKLFIGGEGSRGEGLDPRAVGSFFGANADAGGDRSFDVTELWYEQSLLEDKLILRLGKIDLTGGFECGCSDVAFDCNAFASDETFDFLNAAFGNTATVPFPDNGPGAVVYFKPVDWWYTAVGAGDADADARETGFATTSDGDSHFFYVFETGIVREFESANGPLAGAWRVGVWNERVPKEYLDGNASKRDDVGFYFSGDQMLWREAGDDDNGEGLGAFLRLGWADDKVNELKTCWSFGARYEGLIKGRDSDIIGLGLAQGRFSGDAGYNASSERVIELYYNAELAPWVRVSPSIQWIANPGGERSVNDAAVVALRVQVAL